MEFKAFPKIDRLGNAIMYVTQKIHGSNAQVVIANIDCRLGDLAPEGSIEVDGQYYYLKVGKRTSWISPENDNFGFARFVFENKEEFIRKLGPGTFHGEWAGPGINSGEGLKEKTFVLFDHWRFVEGQPLPPRTVVVPVLYSGPFNLGVLDSIMEDLKTNGSKLVPGFMRPEGAVVRIKGDRYKIVFEAEETQWRKGDGSKKKGAAKQTERSTKYDHLLQPIRLEKLLSRDSKYLQNYPSSIKDIVRDYAKDLVDEGTRIDGADDHVKAVCKVLGPKIFEFVKEIAGNNPMAGENKETMS